MYFPTILLAKASICLQCLRFFSVGRDKAFWTIHIFFLINVLYYVTVWIFGIVRCILQSKIWKEAIPDKLINYSAYEVATGVFNLVSDLLMLLYPLVCVWQLQMSLTKKRGASSIFLIALL